MTALTHVQHLKTFAPWAQLGLTGEWADKPIQTYGYAPTGMSNFFKLAVFHGGTTWNENLKQYVENRREAGDLPLRHHHSDDG